jgi:pimeloyl-ACP methyl ester carboxylesterase
MGGNILLHLATLEPERMDAMVLVSAAMYFPELARAVIGQVSLKDHPASGWETMRQPHRLGDDQIVALREWQRGMADSHDDMNFTPP